MRISKNLYKKGKNVMWKIYQSSHLYISILLLTVVGFFVISCNSTEDGLTPYVGSPKMSKITVESGTFKPKITWSGGFVSVVGVNKGASAKLDSTIIWLIKSNNNDIRYPVTYGESPEGTQNLTSQFKGETLDSLSEDFTYTYWVIKGNLWDQIAQYSGKTLTEDSTLAAGSFVVLGDTLRLSSENFTLASIQIDLFTNITNLQQFGQLGKIQIYQAVDFRGPKISWKIAEAGVPDSLLAAIGIVMAQRYSALNQIWEVWSEENSPNGNIYGKKNIIPGPFYAGATFAGTKVFQEYPQEGLMRNKDYYIWIARSNWDGKTHARTAKGYAYAYFRTW